jgi:hypothetical protein
MVAILEGSPVPRSICLTSASFGGVRMMGLLARISNSFRFILATIVAISSLSLAACAWLQFGLLEHHIQKHALDHLREKEHHWALAS